MSCIYKRGNMLWVAYEDATGKRVCRTSGFRVGQEPQAREFVAELERAIGETPVPAAAANPIDDTKVRSPGPSVRAYGDAWLKKRENRIATVGNEEGHLRNHVYPRIGDMAMRDVKPRHIRDLFLDLAQIMVPRRGKNGARMTKIAPRTVLRIYATLHRMFKSAVIDEVVETNPVVVEKGILPKNIDKDPEWRATAVFDRGELVSLISDARIPEHHRVLNALKGLAALRHGEAAGARWRDYHPGIEPLGKLIVARSYDNERTKTKVTREVPVHPTLALILDHWRSTGWAATFGRDPNINDLIVPNHKLEVWPAYDADDAFKEDLAAVELRNRRGHDLRRTFITLAQVDGARRDLLKVITHGPAADDIINLYTTFPWPALCAEVGKLDVKLPAPEPVPPSPPAPPPRSTIALVRDVPRAHARSTREISRDEIVNASERCSATRSATCSAEIESTSARLTPLQPLSNVFVNRRSPVQTGLAARKDDQTRRRITPRSGNRGVGRSPTYTAVRARPNHPPMALANRSQPLMRIPVDHVAATVHLANGEVLEATLFVAFGEDVTTILTRSDGFIPVAVAKNIRHVARASIASIHLPGAKLVTSDELPTEQQSVRVHCYDRREIQGEVRWTAAENYRRTIDFLNEPGPYLVVHAREGVTYVRKGHVAWIEEV